MAPGPQVEELSAAAGLRKVEEIRLRRRLQASGFAALTARSAPRTTAPPQLGMPTPPRVDPMQGYHGNVGS
eukprot:COSAG05_NODE_7910_length_754_cov_1.209726_2_plen_70_part_01